MGKIIVRLTGGLGNQMHQYAFGLYLQKLTKFELLIDVNFLHLDASRLNITKRNFELDNFQITATKYSALLSNYYLNVLLLRSAMLRWILINLFGINYVINNSLSATDLKKSKIIYVNGVFGTVSQYMEVLGEIKKEFAVNPNYQQIKLNVDKSIVKQNSVAVHVRRTDYLKSGSIHAVLDIDYYKKAFDVILKEIPNPSFYLFGDDELWIKNNLLSILPDATFLNYKGEHAALFDFSAMSYCEHMVTSNSTFSWWATLMGCTETSIVVAPYRWLRQESLDVTNAYPPNWYVI